MGEEQRRAHYHIYPVQPVEISRYLGFCLGNVVKYILRAPFKGTPTDDCQKALQYLAWGMDSPHEGASVHDVEAAQEAIQRLRGYLQGEVEASGMHDSCALYTQYFLDELSGYLNAGTLSHLKQMQSTIRKLQETLPHTHKSE